MRCSCGIIFKQCGYGGIGRRVWFRLRYVSVKINFALLISISVEQLVISPPRSRVVPCKNFRLNYTSGYGGIGRRVWFRLRYDSVKNNRSHDVGTVFCFFSVTIPYLSLLLNINAINKPVAEGMINSSTFMKYKIERSNSAILEAFSQ